MQQPGDKTTDPSIRQARGGSIHRKTQPSIHPSAHTTHHTTPQHRPPCHDNTARQVDRTMNALNKGIHTRHARLGGILSCPLLSSPLVTHTTAGKNTTRYIYWRKKDAMPWRVGGSEGVGRCLSLTNGGHTHTHTERERERGEAL
mmetsp:Transcript_38027/g.95270  ORF Transcript_38027/g.95270 Transcript_38027/m.95270 type:complete len:145 (+) Transcript_38027:355-789(+)